jgi:predicted enzyme related to lactoylglutathione lyase
MSTTSLSLVILAVSDLPRAVRFYAQAFAWKQTVDTDVYVEYRMPNGMRLGLYERHAFGKNAGSTPILIPTGTTAPVELYLYADDAYEAEERLVSAGAKLLSPMQARSWGDLAAYYADPEGNVVVVAQPLPQT